MDQKNEDNKNTSKENEISEEYKSKQDEVIKNKGVSEQAASKKSESSEDPEIEENEADENEEIDDCESSEDEEEKWKKYEERLTGLDAIKVCINENAEYGEHEILSKKLNLSVSTWMKMFHMYVDDTEMMVELREPTIEIVNKLRKSTVIVSEYGSFKSKFESSAPYYFFLTTVNDEKLTFSQSYSVSFHELIDYTIGEIVDSLHINFMVELSWIITEYMLAAQNPKMTIIYGSCVDIEYKYDIPFDVELVKAEMPEFGSFHSKISIFKYRDNKIRLVISTANLYALDWQTRTQGLWVSPFLPLLPTDANDNDGESVTNFKKDFIEYLSSHKEPEIFGWLSLIYRTDFSSVKVFFLGSVPGSHEDSKFNSWGRNKLSKILLEHTTLPENARDWPVVAQSSAVGSFGQSYHSWLVYTADAMSKEKNKKIIFIPEFKFIYPSKDNYLNSYDSKLNVTCLIYNEDVHIRQKWIKDHLYQWKSEKTSRSSAMPHLKCYTRISPDGSEIPWFVLSSANFSRGAWGKTTYNNQTCLHISNYEAGIVFIPQFLINRDTFPINESIDSDVPPFLLPYDVPLTSYEVNDEPFFTPQSSRSSTVDGKQKKSKNSTFIGKDEEPKNVDESQSEKKEKSSSKAMLIKYTKHEFDVEFE